MDESIGILIGLAGVVIAYLTFKKQFYSKPDKELMHLKIQFSATQVLSLQIQQDISELIVAFPEISSCELFEGCTYATYLEFIKDAHAKNLSDQLLENLSTLPLDKLMIQSMTTSIETQFTNLQAVQNFINLTSQKLRNITND